MGILNGSRACFSHRVRAHHEQRHYRKGDCEEGAHGGDMKHIIKAIMIAAAIIVAANAANADDRGNYQLWQRHYTTPELLADCGRKPTADRCMFFIQAVAQASFWFDKCIPNETSLIDIREITLKFIQDNALLVSDAPATNVLLTAIHTKWKCP
jgi:hypothetical protein